jgi:hypothetical protein
METKIDREMIECILNLLFGVDVIYVSPDTIDMIAKKYVEAAV